jgi:hypothetical protein
MRQHSQLGKVQVQWVSQNGLAMLQWQTLKMYWPTMKMARFFLLPVSDRGWSGGDSALWHPFSRIQAEATIWMLEIVLQQGTSHWLWNLPLQGDTHHPTYTWRTKTNHGAMAKFHMGGQHSPHTWPEEQWKFLLTVVMTATLIMAGRGKERENEVSARLQRP